MPMPALMVSHDQKRYVAPNFVCHDLRNTIVPLTTLFTSCATTTGGNGVSDQKVILHPILIVNDLRNAVVPLMTPLVSCDTEANASGIS